MLIAVGYVNCSWIISSKNRKKYFWPVFSGFPELTSPKRTENVHKFGFYLVSIVSIDSFNG
jgi:hypothetical protein